MSKPKILIQFDPDSHASTFDSIVAIDSGIDQLLTHCNVTPKNVEAMIHGAIFTRGPKDLKNTALFFGGSSVQATEAIVEKARGCFFGPMQVSLMSDPNGSNTTAAAAVLCAEKHESLDGAVVTVLGGTGPVGQRIAQIIANRVFNHANGRVEIRLCSRTLAKAESLCDDLGAKTNSDFFRPMETRDNDASMLAIEDADFVFAAGAAGVELLSGDWRTLNTPPKIVVDLNAVPPAGIAGIDVMDNATQRGETVCYGAIGVGGLKMKIHKRCIENLFASNDQALEVNEIYEIGRQLA